MSFKLLKTIDKRTKYAVNGWIRNNEKELKINNVSSMIHAICILYFRPAEIFNLIKNGDIKLSENKRVITKIAGIGYVNVNYGILKISSETDTICVWTLKMNGCKMARSILFGIASSEQKVNTWRCNNRYLFWGGMKSTTDADWSDYGKIVKPGDIVSIHLDLRKAEIELIINDDDQGVAFKNVAKSKEIEYHMLVTLPNINDSVEIVNFTQE